MLRKPKVRVWAALPILVSSGLFIGALVYFINFLDPIVESSRLWLDENLSFLSWLGSSLWWLFGLIAMGVTAYSFVIVAAIVACPFNPILAEAAEQSRTGIAPQSSPWAKVIRGLPSTVFQETKKLLYYFFWAIPVLVLCLLFFPAAPFIWGAFSSWMLALEFSDYPMDNSGLKFKEMRRALARKRMTSFGFGAAVFGFAMIPGLNVLTVPGAVCGATLLWLEELKVAEAQTA